MALLHGVPPDCTQYTFYMLGTNTFYIPPSLLMVLPLQTSRQFSHYATAILHGMSTDFLLALPRSNHQTPHANDRVHVLITVW